MSKFIQTNIPPQVQVTVSVTNVRSGPSTSFMIVDKAYKGQRIECLGKIDSWWVVHMENDTVGVIYGPNAKPYYSSNPYPQSSKPQNDSQSTQSSPTFTPSSEAKQMLDLINARRSNEGLSPLMFNSTLQSIATIRSRKIVSSGVTSPQLPELGSLQDMLILYNINFNTAGENITGNLTVAGAERSLEDDPPHLKNILDSNFHFIGIGITDSLEYGKIFVQDFIG